jgi:transglutaminase-like putative cysteine protease
MSERIAALLFRFLRAQGIPLTLIGIIALVFADSLARAQWVYDSTPFVDNVLLGLVLGAVLARSQFKGWITFGYTSILSVVVTLQSIGRVVPSAAQLGSLQFAELLWVMHLRLLTLSDRVLGWGTALLRGENIQDTGLFILLVGVIIWNTNVWLVWSVARRRNAVEGLIPYGLLLGVNIHLRAQMLEGMWVFVFCALLLIGYTTFKRQHNDWDTRKVGYPEVLGGDWALSVFILALLVGLVARAAPLFGTTQGWRTLSDLVQPAYQQASDTSERLFGGVNPPPISMPNLQAQTPDLTRIGSPLPGGDETIMWVTTSDPPPPPPEAISAPPPARSHYWGGTIFAQYNGRGWEPLSASEFDQTRGFSFDHKAGRYELRQTFEILAAHADTLFAASLPITASPGMALHFSRLGDSALLKGSVSKYVVTSWVAQMSGSDLARASTRYPPEIAATYLQLPAPLPPRVRDLAGRLTEDARNPYEKALDIQNYLRLTYPYRLDVPAPPENRDAVDYFLFEAPGGFCSYYASAMAVMLRTQGVPARVVTGYAMGEFDAKRGAFRVAVSAAHAWVQVYFPGYGWVEFEPTPSQQAIEYGDNANTGPGSVAPTATRDSSLGALHDLVLEIAITLFLLMSIGAAIWLTHGVAWATGTPRQQAQLLYWQMRRALKWVGLKGSASVTPYEFLSVHTSALAARPRLHDAVASATTLYVRAVFSPEAPSVTEIRTARSLWQHASGDWLASALRTIGKSPWRARGRR